MAPEAKISLIAALSSEHRGIGTQGELLWRISEDLVRFKKLTDGHPVIMGRKTWESLPEKFRPLPNRTNIIITRNSSYEAAGATLASSLEEAFSAASKAAGAEEVFVIGGGELYKEALPRADRLYLTLVNDTKDADTFFPEYEELFTREIERQSFPDHTPPFEWITLEH